MGVGLAPLVFHRFRAFVEKRFHVASFVTTLNFGNRFPHEVCHNFVWALGCSSPLDLSLVVALVVIHKLPGPLGYLTPRDPGVLRLWAPGAPSCSTWRCSREDQC